MFFIVCVLFFFGGRISSWRGNGSIKGLDNGRRGLQESGGDSPHVVMVPGGSSDLRFTIELEGRAPLLPTPGQIQGMALGCVGR